MGSRVALRTAILRTGIGGLVIGAGYLIERFMALRNAGLTVSEAISLMGDVFRAIMDRMRRTASLAAEMIGDSWLLIEAGFNQALANMSRSWSSFLRSLASGVGNIPGLGSLELSLNNAAIAAQSASYEMQSSATSARDTFNELAGSIGNSASAIWSEPIPAMERLRELAKETGIDVRDWFGGSGADKDGGGSGSKNAISEAVKTMEKLGDLIKATQPSFQTGLRCE